VADPFFLPSSFCDVRTKCRPVDEDECERVTSLYDVADMAYCSPLLREFSRAAAKRSPSPPIKPSASRADQLLRSVT
jgi:hypothetical protein